jgi:uncharacterized DUF497 family protein
MKTKRFNWNNDKNRQLKEIRGVTFEDIIYYLSKGHLLDVIDNPQNEIYENQKMFVVNIDDYAYLVPHVENDEEIFLKTIFPSRKATKKYLRRKD